MHIESKMKELFGILMKSWNKVKLFRAVSHPPQNSARDLGHFILCVRKRAGERVLVKWNHLNILLS